MELGGQWIGPTQLRMAKLTAELGLETFPTYNTGDHLLRFGDKQGRYRGAIPRLGPLVLADMGQAQARFDRLAARIPLEVPWAADRADALDGQTFETWIRRNARTAKARQLLRLFAESVFAAEASDFSLLHALYYTHSGGGVDALVGHARRRTAGPLRRRLAARADAARRAAGRPRAPRRPRAEDPAAR